MIYGMTGYSHSKKQFKEYSLECFLQTYNHRYLDIIMKLPDELISLEIPFRRVLSQKIKRGKVQVRVQLNRRTPKKLYLHNNLLREYISLIKDLEKRGLALQPTDPSAFLQLPGILDVKEESLKQEVLVKRTKVLFQSCVKALAENRRQEGQAIQQSLTVHLEAIMQFAQQLAENIEKKRKAIMNKGVASEELESMYNDLAVDEEIQRILYHAKQFKRTMKLKTAQPKGKKADFICQELYREANTLAAKLPLAQWIELAILIKSEIEKIRQQVNNVE